MASEISEFVEARPARKQVWIGPRNRTEQNDYLRVIQFVGECRDGKRHLMDFQEALTLSDFPKLFQDLLSREILAMYEVHPKSWPMYFRKGMAPDYRNVRRLALDGAERPLDIVPPNTEIDRAELTEDNYEYAIEDRGRALDIPIQVFVNNDIDSFRDIPNRLLKAAIRSEEEFCAKILADASGPNATHFRTGNNNIITGNPALTVEGLQSAMTRLLTQKDKEGQPIFITGYTLVVSPHLTIQARRILNSIEVRSSSAAGGGDSSFEVLGRNFPTDGGDVGSSLPMVATNAYIPLTATTNGETSWWLIADPQVSRPAGEIVFRIGLDMPRVSMKRSDVVPTAGTSEGGPEMMGSFDRNTISLRVMHTFGGGFLDPRAAVGSNGSGT